MAREVRVVEDGADEAPVVRPTAPRSSWTLLTIGFFVGLSIALFFIHHETEQQSGPEAAGATDETPDEPARLSGLSSAQAGLGDFESGEAVGIADVVDSFPDTLVAVSQGSASTLELVRWPLGGEATWLPLAGFSSRAVRFDAGGSMIALGADVPGSEGMLLSMGVPRRIWPVATDVTGYAWHDAEKGLIAYSQTADGELFIWKTDSSLEPELVTRGVGLGDRLVAWGTWGYAIQDDDGFSLLTADGQLRTTVEGRVLDSDPSGWLVVANEGLRLVSSGGGVDRLEADVGSMGTIEVAQLAPDRSKLAVASLDGHMIIPLEGEGPPAFSAIPVGAPQLAWSSDSRYVLSPSFRGVVLFDSETDGQSLRVLASESLVAVASVPSTER